ncbi:FeoA family protein [Sphingobacterium spiritivorum]|uniref:FeoA family protein n=1 Tax=Sphingobacterium TaxID=28453 RepID=UPI0002F141C9|nr:MULTISPECIES: FeoA family protein [Sphingobacterium]WQD35199.1 FeoA family protein [Sphingobacterium spiritivorum]
MDKLKKGERAKILSYTSTDIPAKFFEIGFLPGIDIEIKHIAPFNGPICVNILQNNALIALRKSEAKHIIVEK